MNSIELESIRRLNALDPLNSFIVQAPAGSGKTELLTQRYLRLLSLVNEPEEVVAVTFTRKAAAEMRERVLLALNNNATPVSEHKKLTHELAQQVLISDQKKSWQLIKNPSRLKILTLDALSTQLASQMPLLSRLTSQAKISEDAYPLYEKAVISLFNNLNDHSETAQSLKHLLLAMDNRAESLAELLIDILSAREQWLALLVSHYRKPDDLRQQLEQGLQQVIKENLALVYKRLDANIRSELFGLVQLAATHLAQSNEKHALCQWLELNDFPPDEINYQPHWLALAQLVLTKEHSWRKSFDKRDGFPSEAPNKTTKEIFKKSKESIKNLIAIMSEDPELQDLFSNIINAPQPYYTEEQWSLLREIIQLLPRLVAELNLIFQAENTIDFIELNISALRALGTPEHPTDLALYLDYQIKHLLIDEFQDTSLIQFKIIEQLTAQWQPDDGRSLFLVGDPMQSIYRFRNAEVGLFLRVQHRGIGNIKLHNIHLTNNYRSNSELVDWINQNFSKAFPILADITTGAVSYSASVAFHPPESLAGVHPYPLPSLGTAAQCLAIVRNYQELDPHSRIAILVRSRSQLISIIPELKKAGLKFKAIELETLNNRPEIEDLISLTRALNHLADRSAWLAILRAPWCALSLVDLHAITQHADDRPLWYSLSQFQNIPGLSIEAHQRLKRFTAILQKALSNKASLFFAACVHNCWLELQGPASCDDEHQLNNANSYFELLYSLEENNSFSLQHLNRKLAQLYAEAHPEASDGLQVMTIHKAKGLEFDHVILPHLESISANESTRLLRWLERPRRDNSSDLLLAPFKHYGTEKEAIYDYLLGVEKQKLEHENLRLLYVAASRAKTSLHLLFELELESDEQIRSPSKRSFLSYLWPELEHTLKLEHLLRDRHVQETVENTNLAKKLKRIIF